jgi:predicted transposase/invertase (TIGR01784 family)
MSKFNKTLEELETYDDKWFFLLKNLDKLYEIPEQLQEKAFLKIFQLAEIAKYKPKERQNYEQSLKEYRDLENSLELKYEKGKKEGRKEGRREGRREGRKEGRIESKTEIALNAIKKGFDDQTIADLTGLSVEAIQKLRIS